MNLFLKTIFAMLLITGAVVSNQNKQAAEQKADNTPRVLEIVPPVDPSTLPPQPLHVEAQTNVTLSPGVGVAR